MWYGIAGAAGMALIALIVGLIAHFKGGVTRRAWQKHKLDQMSDLDLYCEYAVFWGPGYDQEYQDLICTEMVVRWRAAQYLTMQANKRLKQPLLQKENTDEESS